MNYDEQIAEAVAEQELLGTAWPHLNPDYIGGEVKKAPPLEIGSHRSFHRDELNAALIVQELLNRGQTSMDGASGLRPVEGGGWTVWWRDQHWYVTPEEARLGKGGTVGAHHEVMV